MSWHVFKTRKLTILFTKDFKAEPYWWEDIQTPERDPPRLPAKTDVVVIGSGYTGLHAALLAARGGRYTVVLDAQMAGWGCSTRNGGMISTSIKPDFASLAAKHGKDRAFGILKEGHEALAWIEQFVEEESIECDYKVPGRFHAAHTPRHYEQLTKSISQQVAGLEVEAYPVTRAEQRRELDTDAYHGGIVYPRHASLHPAKYHHGLLNRVMEAGVDVVPFCAATGIDKSGNGFWVTTSRGRVTTRDVIVASNGYTGKVTAWQRRRVIPIGSYIIATEPLEPEVMDRLMPTDRVISDTRKVVYYYRPSPDRKRILFGGRVSVNETDPRISGPKLHADLVKLFPELKDTRISHSWVGFVGYTFDTLAHVGTHDGIHYAMGYCGSGVSMASYLGMRISQQLLGLKEGTTAFDGLSFESRPLYNGRPWFLGMAVMYYRWRDRIG